MKHSKVKYNDDDKVVMKLKKFKGMELIPYVDPKMGIVTLNRLMKDIDFELHFSDMYDELTKKYQEQNDEILDWKENINHRSKLSMFQKEIGLEPYYNQGIELI